MKKLKILVLLIFFVALGIFAIYQWVSFKANKSIYDNVTEIPKNKVGLLLGISKQDEFGTYNPHFLPRVDAAVELFKAGKIEYILVSGAKRSQYYDEPRDFKNELIAKGIPEDKIILDSSGFRTLDSVIRAKEIFGLNSFTTISQKFHNQRAIFISHHLKINAIGYNAEAVKNQHIMSMREYLARPKAILDLIFNVQPKVLGDSVLMPY
mgnify:CR=1 FL=1